MKLTKGSNQKYGYVDRKTGQWLISPMYEFATNFNEYGIAIVSVSKGRSIIIDRNNNNVTGKIYHAIEIMRFGYMKVREVDIDEPVDNVSRDSENYAFLKPNGEEIKALRHVYVIDVTDNYTVEFNYRDKFGAYNLLTGKIIEPKYDRIFNFKDDRRAIDYAVVCKKGLLGMIDWDDNIIIPFEYKELFPYKRFGLIVARKKSLYETLDFNGKQLHSTYFNSFSVKEKKLELNRIETTCIKAKE